MIAAKLLTSQYSIASYNGATAATHSADVADCSVEMHVVAKRTNNRRRK